MSQSTDPPPWAEALLRDGYFLFPGLAPAEAVDAASARIQHDLATEFDPARRAEYEFQSYCPALRAAPGIYALLSAPAVHSCINAAIDFDRLSVGPAQIAIRPIKQSAPALPPPHIDGIATAHNGITSATLQTFTLLMGVFLSDTPQPFSGNLTVWPGSHTRLQNYFQSRGPSALREGMPRIALGEPHQILARRGDVVLCQYALAHGVASNNGRVDRTVVYFRLTLNDLAANRWRRLTHVWDGWRIGPDAPN